MSKTNTGNRGYLDDTVNEDGLYPIHGVAMGNNDITVGSKSGEPKLWRPSVLEEAADTLEGKDIVVNHENQDAYMKIGEVEEAKYDEERGVLYRGVIDDDELAEKISRDWLEVSPRIKHSKEHEELEGVKVPERIHGFDNLSVVRRGAAGSNEVMLEEIDELSVEELQASFDEDASDAVEEYQSIANSDEIEELQPDVDYARWLFENREGADGAAERFGCGGTHAHEIDGKTWYMPCDTHDKFLESWKELKEEENSQSEQSSDEEVEEEEFSKHESEEYSKEERRIASQMASYSELTKSECLSMVDVVNPSRETDHASLARMIYKIMGEGEMEQFYSELDKQKDKELSKTTEKDSPLNSIFS